MDLMVDILIKRADNELLIAEKLKILSESEEAKNFMQIEKEAIFYSSVISHSYYAICSEIYLISGTPKIWLTNFLAFYAAKAILLTKGIKTEMPDVHKKTFDEFKINFVDTGILDIKLLEIYKKIVIRADSLLEIFKNEKWKRGNFTYHTIPQANKEPAEDSLKNAKIFISNINKILMS